MKEFSNTHRSALRALAGRYRVRSLAVFGSVLDDTFDPQHSDIDILVEFEPLPPVDRADAYFGLLHDLEKLFSRQVDLVERSAIRNPVVRRSIEDSQVVVYDAA